MKRRGGLASLLVVGLVMSACSGGDDDSAEETTPTTDAAPEPSSEPSSDGGESSGEEQSPVTTEPDDESPPTTEAPVSEAVVRPAGPALPGLLDVSDEPFPNDPDVLTGVLENGLTYYVKANDNPGGKATLRLAIKAGSVNELTEVTGLAHFAEHMLFNGTDVYPENELIDVLRGFGADFGPDVNAYTSFGETVYKLVVPNDNDSLAVGMNVLEQWLSHATIDADEVVNERGVVLDEWRVRTQTTSGRLFEVAQEMYLSGSAYEDRSPIGTAASIESMPADDLREFYDAWYRPDNAAVIVVGEIDPSAIVADIEAAFGSATARSADLPDRPDLTFPLEDEPDFALHADPDQQTVDVEVTLPLPGDTSTGTAAARTAYIDSMIFSSLVRRLDQDRAAGIAPFDDISRGSNSFVETLDAPALYAFTDEQRVTETLKALLDEYVRAFEFGFTDDETDLARESLQSFFDTRFDGRESRQDTDIADALVESFLSGAAYPTIGQEYPLITELLGSITAEALDERFRARWANTAPHVIISTPEAVADQMPSRDDVLALIEAAWAGDVDEREQLRALPDALMERPEPVEQPASELVLDTGFPIFEPATITFPNGVTVIWTTNEIVEGQVYFRAVSPGGSSQVADVDVVDALYAADVVTGGGIADFNAAELAQINADADVSISAWITPYEDNFGGTAATSDLEVLMQMLHLYFTQPRFDEVALDRVRSFEQAVVDDPSSDPDAAGDDALLDARYPGELRYASLPTPEEFATLDLAGVERVWTERHADAGDWTFIFAGDFSPIDLQVLAASYLGTLPATGAEEGYVDVSVPAPTSPVVTEVAAGTGETATVTLLFTTPVSGSFVEARVEADIASEVLGARLTDVVREELGDSYSPFVVSYLTADPEPTIETYAQISGSPDRVDAIADVVLGEFADLAGGGMTDDEFRQAFSLIEEQYNFVNNNLFIEGLAGAQVFPELGVDSFIDRFLELDRVSSGDITDFIAEHVPLDAYVQVTVTPR